MAIRPPTASRRVFNALLSDLEILERLIAPDPKCIFVSPLIDTATQLGPSSLDLRLGSDLRTTRTVASTHIDLTSDKANIDTAMRAYFERREIGPAGVFVLHPGEFALAATVEYIRLPRDIAGRLEGRSSMGRLGLQVHATAGFVDPGFEGTLTYELMNSGKLPVRFRPGIRLGQICFFRVRRVEVPYLKKLRSKYGRKLGVELARLGDEPEVGASPVDDPARKSDE